MSDPDRVPVLTDADYEDQRRMIRGALLASFLVKEAQEHGLSEAQQDVLLTAWATSFWSVEE